MVLHRVCTQRDRTWTVLYNKQFDKLLHDVSYGRTQSANSQPFAEEKGTEKEGEVSEGVCSRSSHFMEAILFFVNHKSARIM